MCLFCPVLNCFRLVVFSSILTLGRSEAPGLAAALGACCRCSALCPSHQHQVTGCCRAGAWHTSFPPHALTAAQCRPDLPNSSGVSPCLGSSYRVLSPGLVALTLSLMSWLWLAARLLGQEEVGMQMCSP